MLFHTFRGYLSIIRALFVADQLSIGSDFAEELVLRFENRWRIARRTGGNLKLKLYCKDHQWDQLLLA